MLEKNERSDTRDSDKLDSDKRDSDKRDSDKRDSDERGFILLEFVIKHHHKLAIDITMMHYQHSVITLAISYMLSRLLKQIE